MLAVSQHGPWPENRACYGLWPATLYGPMASESRNHPLHVLRPLANNIFTGLVPPGLGPASRRCLQCIIVFAYSCDLGPACRRCDMQALVCMRPWASLAQMCAVQYVC